MRKCRSRLCLCRTCLNTCGCKSCKGAIQSCEAYSRYEQLLIFADVSGKECRKAPRKTWEDYGIGRERCAELKTAVQSGKYTDIVNAAANAVNGDIAKYILMSVTENLSYDELQKRWELREIERIPFCRTDFYGYRRLFYHLFDLEIRRIGK